MSDELITRNQFVLLLHICRFNSDKTNIKIRQPQSLAIDQVSRLNERTEAILANTHLISLSVLTCRKFISIS